MLYLTALQEGLLYGLLALGVYISLRVLDIPDLTTEGSFGFGSALAAVLAAQVEAMVGKVNTGLPLSSP